MISPRLMAFVLAAMSISAAFVLAVLLAALLTGCGGGDAEDATAVKPVAPNCERPGVCT